MAGYEADEKDPPSFVVNGITGINQRDLRSIQPRHDLCLWLRFAPADNKGIGCLVDVRDRKIAPSVWADGNGLTLGAARGFTPILSHDRIRGIAKALHLELARGFKDNLIKLAPGGHGQLRLAVG